MKLGVRKFGAATCKLSRTVQVPEKMRDDVVELSSLHCPVEERRNGFASQLVQEICDEADAAGKLLLIHVQPFAEEGMSRAHLRHWYAGRFGFQEIQAKPLLMARMVGATPRMSLKPTITQTD